MRGVCFTLCFIVTMEIVVHLSFGEIRTTTDDGCTDGYFGSTCSDRCSAHCRAGCHKTTEACIGGCLSGWTGDTCNTGCHDYQYGANCKWSCGHCEGDVPCDTITGACPGACVPGFTGQKCNQACAPYSYGKACHGTCSNCRHNKPCNIVTGACITGCSAGWTGDNCDVVCPNNTYGIDCTGSCGHCAGNQSCSHVTGICATRCEPGWTGTRCDISCTVGWYGAECDYQCGHCRLDSCDRMDGQCSHGCASGWMGELCQTACSSGQYGEDCLETCGHCTGTSGCDRTTGICSQGCRDGWQGIRCDRDCPPGTYGKACSLGCGHCTEELACNSTTGACPDGCQTGWMGEHCTKLIQDPSTSTKTDVTSTGKLPTVPLLLVTVVLLFLALSATVLYFLVIRPRRLNIVSRLHMLSAVRDSREADAHVYERVQMGRYDINKSNLVMTSQKLGNGQFGQVRKGYIKNMRSHNVQVAVKSLKVSASGKDKADFLNELQILKKVGYHSNVVCLVGSCHIAGILYVAMEFCVNGDLRSYLRCSRKTKQQLYTNVQGYAPIPHSSLLQFALGVVSGMAHLAERQIIHRDLAARNILLDDKLTAKVADFGLSKHDDTYIKTSQSRVPVRWLALESLFNNIYSTQSDVWSFGVLLWEIVTFGGTPYHGMDTPQFCDLLKRGYRLKRPRHCDSALYAMMLQCWQEGPEARPTFYDLQSRLQGLTDDTQIYINIDDERHYSEIESKHSSCST